MKGGKLAWIHQDVAHLLLNSRLSGRKAGGDVWVLSVSACTSSREIPTDKLTEAKILIVILDNI